MSDMQDFSAFKAETGATDANRAHFIAEVVAKQEPTTEKPFMHNDLQSLDGQTYLLGEVPQAHLLDPQAFLPLNSDKLVGSIDMIEQILREVGGLIESQVSRIEKLQKKITFWEDQIEKNKAVIQSNLSQVKQNDIDITYDKKNRDYWIGRAEQVEHDYRNAEASNQPTNWAWLVKKYGLKNANGAEIDFQSHCVGELCDGEVKNLSAEYRMSGNKYDQDKKNREVENTRLIRENGKLMANNDVLKSYMAKSYSDEIEPIQDGVLLFKELGVKAKALAQDGKRATYGELRDWAEPFLNDFIQLNPRISQEIVTDFRRLASIPLPARNC
jgi:hypothetical protein